MAEIISFGWCFGEIDLFRPLSVYRLLDRYRPKLKAPFRWPFGFSRKAKLPFGRTLLCMHVGLIWHWMHRRSAVECITTMHLFVGRDYKVLWCLINQFTVYQSNQWWSFPSQYHLQLRQSPSSASSFLAVGTHSGKLHSAWNREECCRKIQNEFNHNTFDFNFMIISLKKWKLYLDSMSALKFSMPRWRVVMLLSTTVRTRYFWSGTEPPSWETSAGMSGRRISQKVYRGGNGSDWRVAFSRLPSSCQYRADRRRRENATLQSLPFPSV